MKIKVLTLNTWHGGSENNMYEFLERENADIMLLQEVLNSKNPDYPRNFRSLDELIKLFPEHEYTFAAQANWQYQKRVVEFGTAIFSRFPIQKNFNKFFNYPFNPRFVEEDQNGDFRSFPRNIQSAEIKIDEKVLNVFNVHGVWGFDGYDNEARLNMSKIIIEQIAGKNNVVLGGDTNTWPETKTIRDIKKIMKEPLEGEIADTFNMKYKPSTFDPKQVDILFVSPDVKVVDSYIPMDDVSDHRPLVAVIEL